MHFKTCEYGAASARLRFLARPGYVRRVSLVLLPIALLLSLDARADCARPKGREGEMVYNSDYAVVQFCDGSNWISMAATGQFTESDPKVGTLVGGKWCAANAGATAIVCDQNPPASTTASGVAGAVQFSDGTTLASDAAKFFWDDAAKRLGIGTNAPTEPLHVAGKMRGDTVKLSILSGASPPQAGTGSTETDPQVGTLFADAFCRANSAGTAVVCSMASINLASDVTGSLPATSLSGTITNTQLAGSIGLSKLATSGTASASTYLRGDGAWTTLSVGPSGSAGAVQFSDGSAFASDTSLTWDNTNKRLGIGTASPTHKLDVNGALGVGHQGGAIEVGNGTSTNSNAYIDLVGDATYTDFGLRIIRNNTGANATSQIAQRGTGALYITTSEAAPIVFQTSSLDRMSITSSGNVGIGSSNPGQKLTVAGTIESTSGGFKFPDGSVQTTAAAGGGGDNLGNHTATTTLNMNTNWITAVSSVVLNNKSIIMAKDTGGTDRSVLYGRWSDNAAYLDGGTGGLNLRVNDGTTQVLGINASGTAAFNYNVTATSATTHGLTGTGPSSGSSYYGVVGQAGSYFAGLGRADGYSFVGTGTLYSNGAIQLTGTNQLQFIAYGGGWYMSDSTWIRAVNNKNVYTAGVMRADSGMHTNQICNTSGTNCIAQTSLGGGGGGANCSAQNKSGYYVFREYDCSTNVSTQTVAFTCPAINHGATGSCSSQYISYPVYSNVYAQFMCTNGTLYQTGFDAPVRISNCVSTCFPAGMMVAMADGSKKAIEKLVIGDKVIGRGGKHNTVIAFDSPPLGDRKLYTINGLLKVTGDHPALTDQGWAAIEPQLYASRYFGRTIEVTTKHGKAVWKNDLIKPADMRPLKVGSMIAMGDAGYQKITLITSEILSPDTQLYTVAVDGDGTLQMENGFVFIGLAGRMSPDPHLTPETTGRGDAILLAH